MDRRCPPAGRPRGGARIPSLRPARARLITGLGALAALAAAGAYSTSGAGRFGDLALGAASIGLVVLAFGIVFRWPNLIPWAVFVTGAAYLSGRAGRDLVDGWATVVGVLLLLSAELASWSIEHDARVRSEGSLVVRRVITLALLVLGALLVNFLLLATAALSGPAGILLAATGVVAAVLAVGIVLRLLRA